MIGEKLMMAPSGLDHPLRVLVEQGHLRGEAGLELPGGAV